MRVVRYTEGTAVDSVTGVSKHFSGAVFGQGVYVSTHPTYFKNYGDVCLMCCVLRGQEKRVTDLNTAQTARAKGFHTVIGNKVSRAKAPHKADEIVLGGSDQVVPVFIVMKPTVKCWLRDQLEGLIFEHFNG